VRVLDGTILVIDAVAGVQAQTETVWRIANKHQIPALAFVNKMDRMGADFSASLKSLENRLGIVPVPIQEPIGSEEEFVGTIDLISMEALLYNPQTDVDSVRMRRISLERASTSFPGIVEKATQSRRKMLNALAEIDEIFMDFYIEKGEHEGIYSIEEILQAIRRVCLARQGVPVLCGASLKGVGAEALLDSAISFLPSPIDRPLPIGRLEVCSTVQTKGRKKRAKSKKSKERDLESKIDLVEVDPLGDDLVAFAFKVVHDKRREPLVFVRVYAGKLISRKTVLNSSSQKVERPLQLMQVHADDYKTVDSIGPGQVAVVVGLKSTSTGDTITSREGPLKGIKLTGVNVPESVFSVAIEAERSDKQEALDSALKIICREDPSVSVETDQDTGQTILKGIGELHLEVVRDRLKREFEVAVHSSQVFIAYHESIAQEAFLSDDYEREFIPGRRMYAGMDIKVLPLENPSWPCEAEIDESAEEMLSAKESDDLLNCLLDACKRGPIGGYPMTGIKVILLAVRRDRDTSTGALCYAANSILHQCVKDAGAMLYEPMMALEVAVMPSYLGNVLGDLTSHRRATIREVDTSSEAENSKHATSRAMDRFVLHASVPLRELLGYASALRALSAGEATFSMHLEGYFPMEAAVAQKVLKSGL